MEPTQQPSRPSHRPHEESFSSIASTSSLVGGDLPYANSCLEYGLDLITRALTEQDLDSPRSSTSIRQSPPIQPQRHHDEELDHGTQRRQQVRITFTGAEAEGEEELRRWNNGRVGSVQSSGWEEDDETEADIRQRWRRGTVFLDEPDEQGYLDDGSHGRRRITISTDHSSDDGRNDLGPLTPPANLSGLDDRDSDSGEVWLGRDDRVPSWAAPDIVDFYRNGWSDDRRKQQSDPVGDGNSAESLSNAQREHQQSEWRDEDDEDVRGMEDEDDFSPLDHLHASSSGRSVLPGGRLLLNTGSQDGHQPESPQPRARRPGSGSDVAWRDSGIWSSGLTQSRSFANLGTVAKIQEVEDPVKPDSPPRLRGVRSLLLTKPIAPKRTQSDGPGAPGSSALRELALRRPETATVPTGAGGSRWFDRPHFSSNPASSSPDISNEFHPSVPSDDAQSRKYHYQKPKRSQSWDQNDYIRGKEAAPVSGWEVERERTTLKKEKKPTPSVTKVKASKPAQVGPPRRTNSSWMSSGLAMHGLTYHPSMDVMPRRPATASTPATPTTPNVDPKGGLADSKSFIDTDTKSMKEKKKRASRMGNFVVKVLSSKGGRIPASPAPSTPSTPATPFGLRPQSPSGSVAPSTMSKAEKKSEKGKTMTRPMMVMA